MGFPSLLNSPLLLLKIPLSVLVLVLLLKGGHSSEELHNKTTPGEVNLQVPFKIIQPKEDHMK